MRDAIAVSTERGLQSVRNVLAVCWRVLCVPVHSLLALMEPLVSITLGLLAFLGVCMSLAFRFLRPEFPFWTMMAISLSFVVLLMLYHALLRLTAVSK
jgi:hypothetical protein